jgi:hypothetical protein
MFKSAIRLLNTTFYAPHQKRPEQDARNATKSKENAAKSTKQFDILLLITVWFQVRARPRATIEVSIRRAYIWIISVD